ncbi:MAG: peptide/nickel transport system substrate-binding protein [Chloroflexota bacterium]|jgi:peptide/nickel transport system substrate-binding protein|nr:peptide/nickel transport system substrate-binding protein [Chloroflexota bacterium]
MMSRTALSIVTGFVLLAAACTSAPSRSTGTTGDAAGGSGATTQSGAPKVLRIGAQREPESFLRPGSQGQAVILNIAHAALETFNDRAEDTPLLAEALPATERGTWTVNPDGTMETVWKLRPNVQWHDGTPLTADDLVFTFELFHNPSFQLSAPPALSSMASASAPDPRTLVIRWNRTYALATEPGLVPFPRHILGALVDDKLDRFHNSPYWTTEFVGLGPYRLVKWDSGSSMEFARFDNYFLGRPKLDTVFYSFYPDTNGLVANILSGTIDLHLPIVLNVDQATEIQRRWEGTGNRVLVGPDGRPDILSAQLRPDSEVVVKPAALRDVRVRQALYRAIDRDGLARGLLGEFGQAADSWIPPNDPRRQMPSFRDAIIQYPYDPARAGRELESLGWRKSSDGILVNGQGERFEMEVRDTPSGEAESELNILRDMWQQVGVQVNPLIVTPQRASDREYRSLHPGWEFTSTTYTNFDTTRLCTCDISTPANRYAGGNKGAYSNSEMDALINRLGGTIPEDQRATITADMLRIALTDLPVVPLYWNQAVITAAKQVTGVLPPNIRQEHGWNVFDWDVTG